MSVAVVGKRIAEVAPVGELVHTAGPRTRIVDLQGRLLTPGLWDTHIHLFHWCQMRHQLNLASCHSRDSLERLLEGASTGSGWLIGHGLSSGNWREPGELPDRHLLDRFTGGRPTLLWCSDLHSGLANSAALAAGGLLQGQSWIEGGVIERDACGLPTGWLRELAVNAVRDAIPEPDDALLQAQLLSSQDALHSLGITGVCDQRIKDQNEGPRLFRVLQELQEGRLWKIRTSLNVAAHHLAHATSVGLRTGFGTDWLRLGHIKLFADGTLGSKTARMLEPMLGGGEGADGRGLYLSSPEEMRRVFFEAAHAGWSLSVHAIGDEANRVCLDLFEELQQSGLPRPRIPHRIEHTQMLDDADVPRFAGLGVTASVQAGHLLDDRHIAESFLGSRERLCFRFADLWRAGATLVFGTDAPVSEVDPRYGMRAAVQRSLLGENPWQQEQSLPADVVWDGYTSAAAKAGGWDDIVGTLALGYRADLVAWEGNPMSERGQVQATWSDGELVYSREGDLG